MRRDPLSFQLSTLSVLANFGRKDGRYKRENRGTKRARNLERRMDRQGERGWRRVDFSFLPSLRQLPTIFLVNGNNPLHGTRSFRQTRNTDAPGNCLDAVFPPRIALCVTFWSFHARCKLDGRTDRGHWRGGSPRVVLGRSHVCSIVRNEREAKIKRKKRGERRFENENSISSGVVLAQRFASRERGDSRRREISLARFSARKCFPHSRREIFGAGHFVLRSWSTKGSRDGFANSFHTRPSPIHRGIASKGLVCLVWISRLGEDFDRFRWWDTSGSSIRGIGRFVLVLREKTRCKMVLNMREFFKFSCFITPNFHKPF